ncbi:DNA repair photolyase [Novimethylophilus kurashikiensis]|uniref:DNA repair photolyase n=1 Tax=Novimethylophilus kurashikiensis TaxID=1825523 RepID=A0A2R5F815_9PROT|nr:phage Gp37/Gp68 family protein [Novimethylophilus kurashikiensis]GBG14337.1 DNA repair photolyase [Novimethylophilus kurashikiensis]
MADRTNLLWTDATLNVVTGCEKISQGCKHCYAERDWARNAAKPGTVYFGRKFTDVMCHPERLDQPLRWTRPRKIFVNAMSDLFHHDVPDAFIDQMFAVMALCHLLGRGHVFQILTKRPERMFFYLTHPEVKSRILAEMHKLAPKWGVKMVGLVWPVQNAWLGVTAEHQEAALERIVWLQKTPAAIRWVSAEPLIGPLDLLFALESDALPSIDWVVGGAESGDGARPADLRWFRALRDQCRKAGKKFLFKQWGAWAPATYGAPEATWRLHDEATKLPLGEWHAMHDFGGGVGAIHAGSFDTGRTLDGELIEEYPE